MQLLDAFGSDPFFREFDGLVQRVLEPTVTAPGRTSPGLTAAGAVPLPAGLAARTDILRRGNDILVWMDLPGVAPDRLDVHVEGRVLTVSSAREATEQDGDLVLLRARPHGASQERITLPDGLDVERIEASYEHGVLCLRIPLAASATPRRIEVRTAGPERQALDAG